MQGAAGELLAHLEGVPLVDHHVHGALTAAPTPSAFATALVEGDTAVVPDTGVAAALDSQLGFALRRWCAPLLDLPPHAEVGAYLQRRADLGEPQVNARMLGSAGVATWLVDTGHASTAVQTPADLAAASGASAREVVRLEVLAEQLIREGSTNYAERLRGIVDARVRTGAVAFKSVLAYRTGFDVDVERPDDAAVQRAADAWARELDAQRTFGLREKAPRLVDPVLLVAGIHAAVDTSLPLQLHVGFGDRDLDLDRVDPLLLLPLLRQGHVQGCPVMLLHCYPFERQAGYLAQAFANVHLDVGLAINYLGARSPAVIARSFELAPFSKLLYSSDAWGPAELHHLGALLWRRGTARVLGGFVEDGEWSLTDAIRVAEQVGADNATRIYRL